MKNRCLQLFLLIAAFGAVAPVFAQTTNVYSCVTDLVIDETPKRPGVRRAVFQPSVKWLPGQRLRVRFLDGNEFVRSKVRFYAEQWEEFANIDFVFVESGPAEIRVSFGTDSGSWSFLGKDSLKSSKIRRGTGSVFVQNDSGASMNFGWFNDKTPDEEFRRTTLHEFGHALGLRHEHQNANQNIRWNEEAVYAYFAKQGWSRERTYSQVLQRYGNSTEVTNGVYDRFSIMHYYYPPELVEGGTKIPFNTVLSAGDKAIIAEMYPFDEDVKVVKPTTNKPTPPNPNPTKPPVTAPALPVFDFTDMSVDFEGYDEETERDGMVFTSDFRVKNGLRQEFTMAIYFYAADGTPLEDSNQQFYSTNGKVAVFRKFVPGFADTVYNGFEIFMPYDELELECGSHNLKYSVGIWQGNKRVESTGYTYFELEIPCE